MSTATANPWAASHPERTTALEQILADAFICSESGLVFADFIDAGRDADDFANVSRNTLHHLMAKAYEAGKAAK